MRLAVAGMSGGAPSVAALTKSLLERRAVMSSWDRSGTDQPRDYGVLRWLVAAAFVVILNETVMFNALPSLMREFAVDVTTAQWLSTAFMLTMAVVIPVTGWFLQRVT